MWLILEISETFQLQHLPLSLSLTQYPDQVYHCVPNFPFSLQPQVRPSLNLSLNHARMSWLDPLSCSAHALHCHWSSFPKTPRSYQTYQTPKLLVSLLLHVNNPSCPQFVAPTKLSGLISIIPKPKTTHLFHIPTVTHWTWLKQFPLPWIVLPPGSCILQDTLLILTVKIICSFK